MKTLKEIKEEVKFKIDNTVYRAEVKIKEAANWASQNPELAIAIATATGVVVKKVANTADREIRHAREQKEMKARETKFWDPSLRMWVYSKRPLNSDEIMHFADRRYEGVRVIDILSEMNLAK